MTTNILNHQQECMLRACCLVFFAWRLQATPDFKNKFPSQTEIFNNGTKITDSDEIRAGCLAVE